MYVDRCSSCHGLELTGNSAALIGEPFWQRWGEDGLESLYNVIRRTMPRETPGSLTAEQYVEVVAYLLRMNGLPAGREILAPESVPTVRVQGRDGPGPVPNYALVKVSGCMTGTPASWKLTGASAPVRTRNPDAESTGAPAAGPGSATYQLLPVYPSPEAYRGRLVEAKGFLIRMGDEVWINVTALRGLESAC
jgi:hypothetical protein